MLYVMDLHHSGWRWQHVALFVSMLASTDAVAIIATMKTSAFWPILSVPRHMLRLGFQQAPKHFTCDMLHTNWPTFALLEDLIVIAYRIRALHQ